MIKAVLFDLDGTLLDRDASVKHFIKNQYERLKKWVGHFPKETYTSRFIELDCRGYVWKDHVYQQLVEEFHIKELSWEVLLQDYVDHFKHSCVPFENLKPMLDDLKQNSITLGIISNGKGRFQMDNIEALEIKHYFECILISEWEEIKKPEPEIFLRALKQLDVSPYESVYVGDHPKNDVEGSKQIGMIGIWKRDLQWDHVEADYSVANLSEIPKIIEKINHADVKA